MLSSRRQGISDSMDIAFTSWVLIIADIRPYRDLRSGR